MSDPYFGIDHDHPLALELQSLKAAVAKYQYEVHTYSVKLQRHSLEAFQALEQSRLLERENARLREEVDVLRANPDTAPHTAAPQVPELTLALRKLSDKLTNTEESLLSRTNELLSVQNGLRIARHDSDSAHALLEQIRAREDAYRVRERELEKRVRAAEEERKMSDLVVQEYADLVRSLEGRSKASSRSSSSLPLGADSDGSSVTLAESLAEGKLGLQKLLEEFNGESERLATDISGLHSQVEDLMVQLQTERKSAENDRSQLAEVLVQLDKYKADDNTAAKMVSRYMKFSQSTTDSLQRTMENLRARHETTTSTLYTQISNLQIVLASEQQQSEYLRRSLDDLSEDLSRESYGRRRETSLRLAFLSREESLAEGLRRWTRKSQESLDRIFSQIQPTEDASGLQSSLCNVFHKAIQEAEILLESLNGRPSLTDDSPGSVARIVAAQEIVSSLTRELQVETDRRLRVASMVIQHGYAKDATYSETDDVSSSSSASQDANSPINGDTQSPQANNEVASPTDQVVNTPVSAPTDVVTDATPLTPSTDDDAISPSHSDTETPSLAQLPGDDVQIPAESVVVPDEPLLSSDSLTLAAEPSSDSIVAISIISPSILDLKQLSAVTEDNDASLPDSNETTVLQAQSTTQDVETPQHIPEQSDSHPIADTVILEEPSVVAAAPAVSHVPPTALSLPSSPGPSTTKEDEEESVALYAPSQSELLDAQSTSSTPVGDDDTQASSEVFSPVPDVTQSEEVSSAPITPIIEPSESPAPLSETTSTDSVSSGSNVEVNTYLESNSLASQPIEEAGSGTSSMSITSSEEERGDETLPPPVVVLEPIDVSEESEPVLIPDVEVAESATRTQTATTESERIEPEERPVSPFELKAALVDLDVNEPQAITSDTSSDPVPASSEPEHKSLLTNSKNRASPPSPLALTPSPEELSPIVASSSPITPEHVNDIIFPSIRSEQSQTSPNPHDPRISYLLQNLTLVKHRYDDLQKSYRDCHLALKETKNTVTSLSSSHPLYSTLPIAVDRLNDFNEDARVELEIRIADEERIYAGYETLLSIPGAFSDEVDKTTLEAEIEAFIDGSDKAVDKAMKKFTKQLEDLQHDIASIKRAIHDPPSEPEPPTPTSASQPSIPTPQKSAAWASWAGGLLGSSRPSSPATPARTFGSVMTSPRVRHTSFSHSTLSSVIGGLQSQSQSQQEPSTPNPFANLGLRISMPAHLHIPSHIPPTVPTLTGPTNHLTPSYLPPGLLGSSTTNPNAGSMSSPGPGSSSKPRTAMYMLGLGSRGGGGLGLSGGRAVSMPGGRNSPLLSSALSLGSSGLGKTFPRMMVATDTPTSRHDTSNSDDLDSDVE